MARDHLVVRATGRITGKVRFGELEIERGGQIIGDVQIFGEDAAGGGGLHKTPTASRTSNPGSEFETLAGHLPEVQ